MTKAEIQKIILAVAGNPSVGAIKDLAPQMAEEIEKALAPKPAKISNVEKSKETRVTEVTETR